MIFTRIAAFLAYLITVLALAYVGYVWWWGWTAESITVAMNSSDELMEGLGLLLIGVTLGVFSEISRNIASSFSVSSGTKRHD